MISAIGLNNIYPILKVMDSVSSIGNFPKIPINANTTYVKYSGMKSMYDILESDSLYFFCSELSNDKKENQFIQRDNPQEAYISCFYNSNSANMSFQKNSSDIYSQWMGYCHDGGAAFEFYFYQDRLCELFPRKQLCQKDVAENFIKNNVEMFDLSLISANDKSTSEYVKYSAFPFRVQYYDDEIFAESLGNDNKHLSSENTYLQSIEDIINENNVNKNLVAPFFKHSGFVQECEARLAVVNCDDQISKCVKFLKGTNGERIPYIIAKFGDCDKIMRPCVKLDKDGENIFENSKSIENYIKQIPDYKRERQFPIVIPQGRNQEEIYQTVESIISEMERKEEGDFNIICQGHLPITKITLAPTTDRKEQVKMMEVFCKSKYWLRHVKICESKIPYNTNNINHS